MIAFTLQKEKKKGRKKGLLKSVLLSKAIVVVSSLEYELSTSTDLFRKGGKQTILSCTTLEAPAVEYPLSILFG